MLEKRGGSNDSEMTIFSVYGSTGVNKIVLLRMYVICTFRSRPCSGSFNMSGFRI